MTDRTGPTVGDGTPARQRQVCYTDGMNFFDNPQILTTFGAPASATVELLRSHAPPAALLAAIRDGWFDLQALAEVNEQGQPWLAHWISGLRQKSPRATIHWNDLPWPTTPDGDWSGIAIEEGVGSYQSVNIHTQGELVVGWLLAHAPEGVGHVRWTHQPISLSMAVAPPQSNTGSLVGQLLEARFKKAFAVAMARADRPTSAELNRLEVHMEYEGLGVQVSPRGEKEVIQGYPFAPLLHLAIQENMMEVVGLLKESGADLNKSSSDGTPLHYRANKTATLQWLVDQGCDVLQQHPLEVPPLKFWEYGRSRNSGFAPSTELSQIINTRLMESHTPEELLRLKMPEVSQLMANPTSFAAFSRQVQQLKIPTTIEWTEGGENWTWSRQGLALLLDAPLDANYPTWKWAIQCSLKGDRLFDRVPNEDLLWLVGQAHESAERSWAKQAKKHGWTSPLNDPERAANLVHALQSQGKGLWKTTIPQLPQRNGWLMVLGQAQHKAGLDPWKTWHLIGKPDPSLEDNAMAWKLAIALVEETHQHLQTPNGSTLAGRCLGEALVLTGHMRIYNIQNGSNPITQDDLDRAATQQSTTLGTGLAHALLALKEAEGILDDGAQGERIQAAIAGWDTHAPLKDWRKRVVAQLMGQHMAPMTALPRPAPRF